ncbi:MAG: hypothetical protein MI743_18195 [Sneathiellales bacterium]|nr:hypothetical protein [Sneathiellales bacterium]
MNQMRRLEHPSNIEEKPFHHGDGKRFRYLPDPGLKHYSDCHALGNRKVDG